MSRFINSLVSNRIILENNNSQIILSNVDNNLVLTSGTGAIVLGAGYSVETVSGNDPLNPDVTTSLISGTGHSLGDASQVGFIKNIVNVNENAYQNLGTGLDSGSPSLTTVFAIAIDKQGIIGPTGHLYVGGNFTNAGGIANSANIVSYNPTSNVYSSLGTGLGNTVRALVFDELGIVGPTGHLYVGGDFIDAGGLAPADRIARWDGTGWNIVGTGPTNNAVFSLAFDTQGIVGPTGNLYAGGNFNNIGGTGINRVGRYDGTRWNSIGFTATNNVADLKFDPNSGDLTIAAGNFLYNYDGASISQILQGNSIMSTIAFDNTGTLYVGGSFTFLNSVSVSALYIAKFDGTNWSALGNVSIDNPGGPVLVLLFDDSNNLYAGGNFSNVGGLVNTRSLGLWNGSNWLSIGNSSTFSGTVGTINTFLFDTGNLYIGGNFNKISNVYANRIVKLVQSDINSVTTNLLFSGQSLPSYFFTNKGQGIQLCYIGGGDWVVTNISPNYIV